jgi:hypothetical protein
VLPVRGTRFDFLVSNWFDVQSGLRTMWRGNQANAKLVRIVVWEAALSYTVTSWELSTKGAWPANDPLKFLGAVVGAAVVALFLCHIVPAELLPRLLQRKERATVFLRQALIAWYGIGAVASFINLTRAEGQFVLWGHLSQHQTLAVGAGLVFAVLGILAVQLEDRLGLIVPGAFGVLGFFFVLSALLATYTGFWTRNEQLISENGLADNAQVFKGVLLATVPATIFGIRLGRLRPTRSTVFWTGVLGVWLPVTSSAVLAALAKMCGARRYWRPSVPIDTGPFSHGLTAPLSRGRRPPSSL